MMSPVPPVVRVLAAARKAAATRKRVLSAARTAEPTTKRVPTGLPERLRAQSLVEVSVGILLLGLATVFLLDLAFLFVAHQRNESLCQEAARAAASGDPAYANRRAEAVVVQSNSSAWPPIVSNFAMTEPVKVTIESRPKVEIDPISDKPVSSGGAVHGSTSVATQVEVNPFLIHRVCGMSAPIKLNARQTAPIRCMVAGTDRQLEAAGNDALAE